MGRGLGEREGAGRSGCRQGTYHRPGVVAGESFQASFLEIGISLLGGFLLRIYADRISDQQMRRGRFEALSLPI
jgi:hypothetical protein